MFPAPPLPVERTGDTSREEAPRDFERLVERIFPAPPLPVECCMKNKGDCYLRNLRRSTQRTRVSSVAAMCALITRSSSALAGSGLPREGERMFPTPPRPVERL